MNLFDLRGKVALLTGATRGIGRAIATAMARHGAQIVLSSDEPATCAEVAASLRAAGFDAIGLPCDVRERTQVEALVEATLRERGRIDILVAKAGCAQLARNLAVEWGPSNVRVNAISPGVIRTEFARPMLDDEDIMRRRIALTPLRRIGEPEEIAGVAVMLASPAGAFITGQNLVVDGGTLIGDGS